MALLDVGRITKPHGVRGDVLVAFTSDRTSRLDRGSVLVTDRGPLTVVSASVHHDRWIVRFEEINGRDQADAWRGAVLQAEPVDEDEGDALWVHQLVGSRVVLTDGNDVGEVTAVLSNPASDLLELDSGALVPVVFITGRAPGRVEIDPPEGLFDL
jgi:16S rRNA processing protein RimM